MRKSLFFFFTLLFLTSCSEEIAAPSNEFVAIPTGMFFFGSDEGSENEGPVVPCRVNEFQLAITEVSNEQFELFVNETGYLTDSEKSGGMVFDGDWKLVKSANWKMPMGKKVDREEWKNLPVVQISYADALAYCAWSDSRLPSEIEWEYAAKMGRSNLGEMNIINALSSQPKTADVRSFGKNDVGIYHQSGNVWEWCADVYNSEVHDKLGLISTTEPFDTHQGRSFDPEKMNVTDTLRVIKGGSFLCQTGYCAGYRPEARQSAEQHQGYFHIGFRIAKNTK